MLSIFLCLPPPVHCLIQGRETFFDKANKIDIFERLFFLVALRFRSKLKQGVNISPFVNHFMLKNPRALDTFCMPIKWKCIPETK